MILNRRQRCNVSDDEWVISYKFLAFYMFIIINANPESDNDSYE